MTTNACQLERLLSAVATLTDEGSDLKHEVTDLKAKVEETRDIVEAWQAVKTGGRFLKWIGGVVAAAGGAAAFVKFGFQQTVGR